MSKVDSEVGMSQTKAPAQRKDMELVKVDYRGLLCDKWMGEDIAKKTKGSFSNLHVRSKTQKVKTFSKWFKALRIPKPSVNLPQCLGHRANKPNYTGPGPLPFAITGWYSCRNYQNLTSENSGLEDWKTMKDYFPFGGLYLFLERGMEFQANLANHQRGERDLETSPGFQAFVAWR